ncbi:MAG: repair protein SbcD/Mre11 [Frankiales bacterium]|jgi:exonuclease SbcD|nr:repair protein SbcD/Mre11 [Frankiales bacterium]
MRLLHTSDWHLGRSFHRERLLPAQADFVDFLVGVVKAERVDAVLISGDLFDRALPPVDAVMLADEALRRLADAGAQVVTISGNHDSARRLGFAADLIAAAGVHIRTDPEQCDRAVQLGDAHGPVAVYALPYLEPELVRETLAADAGGHQAVLTAAMARVRADLAAQPAGTRSIVLAHAFVDGGQPCESERDITAGGVAVVPAATFAGVDYAALGHLHGRQTLTPTTRYSGSPLAYSFSEAPHTKGCWLVELDAHGVSTVEPIETPVPRRLAQVRGSLDTLLTDAEFTTYEDCWLQVTLTDAARPAEPMERLRKRFPHTLVLAFEPDGAAADTSSSYAARLRGQSDIDVALGFVDHVRHRPASEIERVLLDDAFAAVRATEVAS